MVLDPKISIVTVNFNEAENLELTINKSIAQTFKNKEIIIIDGGSNDDSPKIIEKYKAHIYFYCSEKDDGIYDAMNKGIKKATGDWIIFMNSGDWFFNDLVLEKIFSTPFEKNTFLYGNHQIRYEHFTRMHIASKPLETLKYKNVFSHQALFSPVHLMKKNLFDLKYPLVSDFDSFYKHFKLNFPFKYIPETISTFEAGGVSEVKGNKACSERWQIVKKHDQSFGIKIYYLTWHFKLWFIRLVKSFLPKSAISFITKLKYRLS